MNNNQMKAIFIQWIGPMAVLMLALVIMLINFSTKSRLNANSAVNRNIVTSAENCARILNDELLLIEKVGKPIAEILSRNMADKKFMSGDMSYEVELLQTAVSNSGAHKAYICDAEGNAINNSGEKTSLTEKDFYERLHEEEGIRYLYGMDGGLNGHGIVITAIPIVTDSGDNLDLLMLYHLDNFSHMLMRVDFNTWNLETIIDKNGDIIASYGNKSYWKQSNNVFEALKDQDSEVLKRLNSNVNGKVSSVITVNKESSLVSAYLGVGDWVVLFGVSQRYIDKQVEQQWIAFKNMVYQLVIVFCVFIVFVVAINIASKIYNNKKQAQLESKADTDLLTGLNNKLATERKIKEFIAKNPQTQSMLFIFDIDNFKKINDTMGHAFGDEVLRSLGQQIRVIFRASDVVGRAGGDEFIVFLKNISTPEVVRKEAKKVEDFFKDFKAGEYTKYSATASIGVAIFPHEGTDFESLYKAADSALYKAKKRGKNQLAFYNEEWTEKNS